MYVQLMMMNTLIFPVLCFIITINDYWYDSFAMSFVMYVRFRACLQLVIIIYNGVK